MWTMYPGSLCKPRHRYGQILTKNGTAKWTFLLRSKNLKIVCKSKNHCQMRNYTVKWSGITSVSKKVKRQWHFWGCKPETILEDHWLGFQQDEEGLEDQEQLEWHKVAEKERNQELGWKEAACQVAVHWSARMGNWWSPVCHLGTGKIENYWKNYKTICIAHQ